MIKVFFKIIGYKLSDLLGFPKMLPINYTITVTYKCNSKCLTCDIYKRKSVNLKLDEYEKILSSIKQKAIWVTISGGEPFLRQDLVEICQLIYQYIRPKFINIPTNGILTSKIMNDIKKICISMPQTKIIVNLSIDGIGEEHNRIRNCDCYDKAIETFNGLKSLKYKNLNVGIHTVISTFNVENFHVIANQLISMNPDSYITEIAEEREELLNFKKNITPNAVSYRSAVDFLIHRIKNHNFSRTAKLIQSFRIEYYKYVKNLLRKETQLLPCQAGKVSCQILPDGEVWLCCIHARSIGNLKDFDLNFQKLWFNKKRKREQKNILKKKCKCTLANAYYSNILLHFPTLFKIFLRNLIKL